MSVLVFLYKSKYVEWHKVVLYSLKVEKWKANQEIMGCVWSDENDCKACFYTNTWTPYILYEKVCAIQAKMMKPLLHINNS